MRLGKVWNLVTTAQHGTLQKLLTKDSNTEIEDEDEYDLTPIEWLVEQLTVDTTDKYNARRIKRLRENGEWEATASVLIEHGADLTKALPNIIDHKNATDCKKASGRD